MFFLINMHMRYFKPHGCTLYVILNVPNKWWNMKLTPESLLRQLFEHFHGCFVFRTNRFLPFPNCRFLLFASSVTLLFETSPGSIALRKSDRILMTI